MGKRAGMLRGALKEGLDGESFNIRGWFEG